LSFILQVLPDSVLFSLHVHVCGGLENLRDSFETFRKKLPWLEGVSGAVTHNYTGGGKQVGIK
jgi:hypothetical protein